MTQKISVIMGVYNNVSTIRAAVDSILAQTYDNWEFIICDDCSTDGTAAILEQYAAQHPDRIVLLRNESNLRLAASLNRCLEVAAGELIARMDGDDISLPNRLEVQARYLAEHPEVDLVSTAMQRFSEEEGFADIVYASPAPDRFSLYKYTPFCHATILTYKRVYAALGGYTVLPRTARTEDYDLWARFFHAGFTGVNIPEALYLVREDRAAIERRSFRVRWRGYATVKVAYRLLDYPRRWLVRAWLITLIKSLTPFWAQEKYRNWQKRRFLKQKEK
ncbi:MAG: glycosyltransferase [Clostridiales bacterium]|nr:glycosyltransferase [Clostridiales bacterium]